VAKVIKRCKVPIFQLQYRLKRENQLKMRISQKGLMQQLLNRKFSILTTDSGLKAHQSPHDWASGSLNSVN
jgi:hypothetical protein